ncbi:hypothetical protein WG31_13785 (plasmid) [Acetobacter oryzifermentans]|uniref:Secreted protein n=1 Tax=Acetobacter oryzifermentans TaxID=1633874 RepID=A0ABN4NXS4_9PROT|nr:hypothetical protein WG31_13785 [Acetobacter oryzifermentans]
MWTATGRSGQRGRILYPYILVCGYIVVSQAILCEETEITTVGFLNFSAQTRHSAYSLNCLSAQQKQSRQAVVAYMSDIKVGWLAFRIADIVRAVPRYHLEPRVG